MSKVAISLFVFGLYLVINGIACAFVPNSYLGLFGQPPTFEPWIRNAGVLMLALGYFYIQVARADLKPFYMWTVYARIGTFIIFILFVLFGWAPATLSLFATFDLLGALWTYLTLRSTRS
jgi:hypothetical protein